MLAALHLPIDNQTMNENDLRVIKTQQHIEQAFLKLLAEKPYRAITVQDILEDAQINRSTFYRHYASKDALAETMVAGFRTVYEQFLAERCTLSSQESLANWLARFWQFIYSQKSRILALWQIKTPTVHLYDDMYALIRRNYIVYAEYNGKAGDLDYQGHCYAHMVLSSLTYTLECDVEMSVDNMRQNLLTMLDTARMKTEQIIC